MRGRSRPKQRARLYWLAAATCVVVVAFVGGWFIFGGAPRGVQSGLDVEERYSQGVIAQALGDFAEAQRAFREVVALDPAYKDAAARLIAVSAELTVAAPGGAPETLRIRHKISVAHPTLAQGGKMRHLFRDGP